MKEWQVTILYMGIFLVVIFLDAIGDALYDRKLKTLSGVLQSILLGFFVTCVCLMDAPVILRPVDHAGVIWLLVGYVCLRYALFDYVYNVARDINIFYTGSTKLLDKFWRWWFRVTKIPAPHWFLMTRFMALLFGLHSIAQGIV